MPRRSRAGEAGLTAAAGRGPAGAGSIDPLDAICREPARTGLFFDFDGTLSDIVLRPDLPAAAAGVQDELARLAGAYAIVAVVSGRPGQEIRRLVAVSNVVVFGLYGLEEGLATAPAPELRQAVEEVAAAATGAWVEDKGVSLAVHYRSSPRPEAAERILGPPLAELAVRHGLTLLLGKMVVELAPSATPGKGAVVLRETLARRLAGCLYAGDDVADLEAFAALDELRERGLRTVKLAVRSAEAPSRLIEAADIVVDGSRGVVEVLRRL